MKKAVILIVSGRVQNVGFRYFTKSLANQSGVSGYVKNLTNGDVLIEAEAEEDVLNYFIENIKKGPSHAYVSDVTIQESEIQAFVGFRYG